MEIILMRHGRPNVASPARIPFRDYRTWHEAYDAATVSTERPAPAPTTLAGPVTVLTSDLRRATDSARIVCPSATPIVTPELRELPVPPPRAPVWFPNWLRLSPHVWSACLRLVWFFGYSGGGESRSAAVSRVKKAVDLLIAHAQSSERILVVAHGWLNIWIAWELRRRGWSGPKMPARGHWACTRYEWR